MKRQDKFEKDMAAVEDDPGDPKHFFDKVEDKDDSDREPVSDEVPKVADTPRARVNQVSCTGCRSRCAVPPWLIGRSFAGFVCPRCTSVRSRIDADWTPPGKIGE